MIVACRFLVSGLVQGVGFRFFTDDAARREGLTGFVRNLDDGRVKRSAAAGASSQAMQNQGTNVLFSSSREVRSLTKETTKVKRLILASLIIGVLAVSTTLVAHPHFNKTVSTSLNGVDVKVSYLTVPANESHTRDAAPGQFISPLGPQFEIAGDLSGKGVSIPVGTYTVGVVKSGSNDWSLVLYPGRAGGNMDMNRAITLDSMFSTEMGTADHILIDITPGHGAHEGIATLTIHFGSLFISGALT